VQRLLAVHSLRHRIRFTEGDAMSLLPDLLNDTDTAAFMDPPYVLNGGGPGIRLYRHTQVDHEKLFSYLAKARCACLATYHPSPTIRRLAGHSGFHVSTKAMQTAHHRTRRELILRKGASVSAPD
jgi:DNA adenine methylase